MRFCGSEENQRLERLLQDNLAREMRLWRAPVLHGGCIQGSDIAPNVYREIITWLQEMSGMFKFCSETFALGVCVLNRLLATVKAQSKYLKCMAITSLILAAKINEEDEVTASVKDLLAQSGCSFSTAEILRMERIILDKLHWDLYTATPIDFIHIVSSRRPTLIASSVQTKHNGKKNHKKTLNAIVDVNICERYQNGVLVPLNCALLGQGQASQ
ncbi:cyclin-I [Electrophorus electricus]|uniref:cyclin-I n=1 Tax=Electrophorus electricus TaxID=8005 RepID=UPI000F0A044A|nr:cyclin-I [Electrophorus electricus]